MSITWLLDVYYLWLPWLRTNGVGLYINVVARSLYLQFLRLGLRPYKVWLLGSWDVICEYLINHMTYGDYMMSSHVMSCLFFFCSSSFLCEDYVSIGPRFSNMVLQTLLILLRKIPPISVVRTTPYHTNLSMPPTHSHCLMCSARPHSPFLLLPPNLPLSFPLFSYTSLPPPPPDGQEGPPSPHPRHHGYGRGSVGGDGHLQCLSLQCGRALHHSGKRRAGRHGGIQYVQVLRCRAQHSEDTALRIEVMFGVQMSVQR